MSDTPDTTALWSLLGDSNWDSSYSVCTSPMLDISEKVAPSLGQETKLMQSKIWTSTDQVYNNSKFPHLLLPHSKLNTSSFVSSEAEQIDLSTQKLNHVINISPTSKFKVWSVRACSRMHCMYAYRRMRYACSNNNSKSVWRDMAHTYIYGKQEIISLVWGSLWLAQ